MFNNINILKNIFVIFFISNASCILNAEYDKNCFDYDYELISEFVFKDTDISNKPRISMINPFDEDRCFHIHTKKSFLNSIDHSYLDNKKDLIDLHKKGHPVGGPSVTIYNYKNKENYYLMLLDLEYEGHLVLREKAMKQHILRQVFDEFIVVHELMHLNPDITLSEYDIEKKESLSDLASIVYLGSKYKYSVDKIIKITKELRKTRRKLVTKTRSMEHYDNKSYVKFLKYFQNLKKQNNEFKRYSLTESLDFTYNIIN